MKKQKPCMFDLTNRVPPPKPLYKNQSTPPLKKLRAEVQALQDKASKTTGKGRTIYE